MNPLLPLDYLILLSLALSSLILWWNWRSTAGRGMGLRLLLLTLRATFLGLLFVIALNPGHWKEHEREEESAWLIMLDNSASMAVPDADGVSRFSRARSWVEAAERTLAATGAPVHRYSYAHNLSTLADDWPATPHSGTAGTRLVDALEHLWPRLPDGISIAGVLIAGDGRESPAADPGPAIVQARVARAPLHTYAVGGEVEVPDLAVRARPRRLTVFADQRPVIRAEVSATGLGRIRPQVELLDATGKLIDKASVNLDQNSTASVSFELSPLSPGYHEYRLHVPPQPGESQLANNEQSLGIIVLEGDLNVLLVEGSPHWDTKFIVQLLRESAHVRLTTVHRVTSDRFFRVAAEEAGLSEETSAVFPESSEELAAYDLVLFGKGVEYFIDEERAAMLHHYVSADGGALIFTRGKAWQGEHDGLERLHPFVWGEPIPGALRWRPTVHGESAGLFGQALPGRDEPLWERIPPVSGINRVDRLGPFAQVLVEGRSPEGHSPVPLLITRRLGQGIVAAINVEGLWEWDFFPTQDGSGEFYRDFWAQIIQWAGTYAEFLPGQHYALRLSQSTARAGEAVRYFIAERDRPSSSADDAHAAPQVIVTRGNTGVQTLRPSPVVRGSYRWHGFAEIQEPGLYRLSVRDPVSGEAEATTLLEVLPPPSEMDNLSADPGFLQELARATGGIFHSAQTPFTLPEAALPPPVNLLDSSQASWQPTWGHAWLCLILIILIGAEWSLRRRLGML